MGIGVSLEQGGVVIRVGYAGNELFGAMGGEAAIRTTTGDTTETGSGHGMKDSEC
jgi:hypothetical protein